MHIVDVTFHFSISKFPLHKMYLFFSCPQKGLQSQFFGLSLLWCLPLNENGLFCYDSHLPLNLFDCDAFATLCANKRACASKGVLICFEQKTTTTIAKVEHDTVFKQKKIWENCENMKVT